LLAVAPPLPTNFPVPQIRQQGLTRSRLARILRARSQRGRGGGVPKPPWPICRSAARPRRSLRLGAHVGVSWPNRNASRCRRWSTRASADASRRPPSSTARRDGSTRAHRRRRASRRAGRRSWCHLAANRMSRDDPAVTAASAAQRPLRAKRTDRRVCSDAAPPRLVDLDAGTLRRISEASPFRSGSRSSPGQGACF
jgi:hypothetical protein